jgi:hypothetical protein
VKQPIISVKSPGSTLSDTFLNHGYPVYELCAKPSALIKHLPGSFSVFLGVWSLQKKEEKDGGCRCKEYINPCCQSDAGGAATWGLQFCRLCFQTNRPITPKYETTKSGEGGCR